MSELWHCLILLGVLEVFWFYATLIIFFVNNNNNTTNNTRRPRAHWRVNPYRGAHRQNETEMFWDHDETSPLIAAVSAPSVACSMLAVQQQKRRGITPWRQWSELLQRVMIQSSVNCRYCFAKCNEHMLWACVVTTSADAPRLKSEEVWTNAADYDLI